MLQYICILEHYIPIKKLGDPVAKLGDNLSMLLFLTDFKRGTW